MTKKEQPSYYAIIPATVRYDDRLTAFEKLMYGEITCLTAKDGKCWASNTYFGNLYKKNASTIRRAITSLVEQGYLKRIINKNKDTKKVESRYLFVNITGEIPVGKNACTSRQKCAHPTGKNAQYNTIKDNTINKNKENIIKEKKEISINPDVLKAFKEHRIKMKAPVTEYALRLLFKKAQLCLESGYVDTVEDAFNISIERGWKGINPEWLMQKKQVEKHKTVNQIMKELTRG